MLRKGTNSENEVDEGSGELRDWLVDKLRTVSLLSTGEEVDGGRLKDLTAGRFSKTEAGMPPPSSPPSPC